MATTNKEKTVSIRQDDIFFKYRYQQLYMDYGFIKLFGAG